MSGSIMSVFFLLCVLVLVTVHAEDRFITPPTCCGANGPTWTIGQPVTAQWSVSKSNYDLFFWPGNDPTGAIRYIITANLTKADTSYNFTVPDLRLDATTGDYHLTLIDIDPATGAFAKASGASLDSAPVAIRPRPSASSSGAAAFVTVTAAPGADAPADQPTAGPRPLALGLGLGLGLGVPLLAALTAAALLWRKVRGRQGSRGEDAKRGVVRLEGGQAPEMAAASPPAGATNGVRYP